MNTTTKEGLGTSDGNTTTAISSPSTRSTATVINTSTSTTNAPITTNPTITSEPITNSTIAQAPDDDHTVKITCGVIFGIIGVALIVIGVIFLLRWRRRRRANASGTGGHDDVTIRPSNTGEPGAYSKLGATKSIHQYGDFNGDALTATDELYGNQDTGHAPYNNVTRSGTQAHAKKAIMPPEVLNNETYEDIAQHASAEDGKGDPMYMMMNLRTNQTPNNKSHTSMYSDVLQKPSSHSPGGWQDSGYVNTMVKDKRFPAALTQADLKSSDSETLSHKETDSTDYINTTTIDEIVANGFGNKENRPDKRNRKK